MLSLDQIFDLYLAIRWFLIFMAQEGFTWKCALINMATPKHRQLATLTY